MPNLRRRVLIVEDDYMIATELAREFEVASLSIVGPAPSLPRALDLINTEQIDAAVLDIKLDGETVYELADTLIARGLPVVFVTGYERLSVPVRYKNVPLCLKPVDSGTVIAALTGPG